MKAVLTVTFAIAIAIAGFGAGWVARGQRPAKDDLWWTRLSFPFSMYGVELSRDPSCRTDFEACMRAIDCRTSAQVKGLKRVSQLSPSCQDAWRAHPKVVGETDARR